jgi:hypothetical protein
MAIPASLWEWDDILFARALHKYDLAAHTPHPPGFPVFVVMTRAAYWMTGDEQTALTTIAFIFASFIAPALFYFYLTVVQDRRIAFAGALLGSFAPSVWVQGGAGRSDGVAFTLGIIGLTLVIRGFQSQRSLIAGCAFFGLAMGVRTTLLPVMGPIIAIVLLARLRRREWRSVLASVVVGAVCILVWYVPMVYHVGWRTYRSVMDSQSQYVLQTDAIFPYITNSSHLIYRSQRFFVHIWGIRWIMQALYTLSLLGLIGLAIKRQWRTIGLMALAFLPYLIFTFLLNSPLGAPLYSLPYLPFFTGLAACGLIMTPSLVPGLFSRSGSWRSLENLGLLLAVCLTIAIAGWTYPIIKLLHSEVSPPMRAFDHLKKNLDPENDLLLYSGQFSPYIPLYLPNHKVVQFEEELDPEINMIWSPADRQHTFTLTSNPILGVKGEHFLWMSSEVGTRRLGNLSRERYFGAHIADMSRQRGVVFLSGWYPPESDQNEVWRWMSRRGRVALYSLAESMTLRLRGSIVYPPPPDRRPTLIFRMNGAEVDRITIDGSEIDHQFTIKPNPSLTWSIISLEIDQTVIPSARSKRNTEELGLKCLEFELSPAPGAPAIKTSSDQYFGTGWQELENTREAYWRWTSGSSIAYLPAIEGDGRLDLRMGVPQGSDDTNREVTVEAGGIVLGKFRPPHGYFTKSYEVPRSLHRGAKLELKLSLPTPDSKSPAMQILYLSWRPSEKN